MKKITKKELKIIQNFVDTIDSEILVNKGKYFECDTEEKEIYIGGTKGEKVFMDWLQTQKEYVPIHPFLISLLHEIGHIQTYTKENDFIRDKIYAMLQFLQEQKAIDIEQFNKSYFEIPSEFDATMWGLNYYKHHKTQCDNLLKKLNLE